MWRKHVLLVWSSLIICTLLLTALLLAVGRTGGGGGGASGAKASPAKPENQSTQARPRPRNISLQPHALNLARQLGKRFAAEKRERSELIGSVTIGAEHRTAQIIRRQRDDGEEVEISISGWEGPLTWSADRGAYDIKRTSEWQCTELD